MDATLKPGWWRAPAALVLLGAVPLVAGAVRLTELSTGAEITADNARFFSDPAPVVTHVISSVVFSLVGAFQFSSAIRRTYPRWHKVAGRAVVAAGLLSVLSGLWMTQFYQLPDMDNGPLYWIRLAAGGGMAAALVIALNAILRRDVQTHRAWMIRGYALGLGAGTQVLTHVPWLLVSGEFDQTSRALLMGAGWAINLAVAEWIIRRPRRRVLTPAM